MNLITVHRKFERHWPLVADHLYQQWSAQGETNILRVKEEDERPLSEIAGEMQLGLSEVKRLICLGVPLKAGCVEQLVSLQETALPGSYRSPLLEDAVRDQLVARKIPIYSHSSEGFWGQSVSEFALGLTICALRRIPQNYHEMLTSHEAWSRYSPARNQGPGTLGAQFSDNSDFTNGTICGKRVRVVGMGNIGSRYANIVKVMGADVAAYDPFAAEPHFHRTGVRKEWRLEELVKDAEIFAPMLPLSDATRGLVTAECIEALPKGCLVVLATRAKICDVDTIRRRVLADELSLAADVFDVEPVPLDDPLLGRHNVVHTPHLAGRTKDANHQWADDLLVQFEPVR
ncbi:MAG: NAD(P)-dependent oxidoreductase [Chloroflexota bacterium]